MGITPTIRAELEQYLKQEGLSMMEFGHIAGMNRGIVSSIVSGNKSMSVNQIDRITEAMGLPEGYFYDLFIENYIIDTPPEYETNRAIFVSLCGIGQAGCDPSSGGNHYGQPTLFA
ncbi:hypothetical protein KAI37_03035 [Paenibacillus sp. S25]|nr:hypothetical protein KAI37_03035 [Paenibacillus sp. S25]